MAQGFLRIWCKENHTSNTIKDPWRMDWNPKGPSPNMGGGGWVYCLGTWTLRLSPLTPLTERLPEIYMVICRSRRVRVKGTYSLDHKPITLNVPQQLNPNLLVLVAAWWSGHRYHNLGVGPMLFTKEHGLTDWAPDVYTHHIYTLAKSTKTPK